MLFFFEISCLLLEISVGGVGLWQGIFPYISYVYKDIQIEMFEYEIGYEPVEPGPWIGYVILSFRF